jgi:hypothetical protein
VRCCGVCSGDYEYEVDSAAAFAIAREDDSRRGLRLLLGLVVAIPAWSAAMYVGQRWDVAALSGWAALGAKLFLYGVAPLLISAFVANTAAAQTGEKTARIIVQLAVGVPAAIIATAFFYVLGFLVGERVEDGTGTVAAAIIATLGFAASVARIASAIRSGLAERRQLELIAANSGQPIPIRNSTPTQARATALAGLVFFFTLVPARALWMPEPLLDDAPADPIETRSADLPTDRRSLAAHKATRPCVIRRAPSDASTTLTRIDAGVELLLENEANARDGWRRVESGRGQTGWARQKCFE